MCKNTATFEGMPRGQAGEDQWAKSKQLKLNPKHREKEFVTVN